MPEDMDERLKNMSPEELKEFQKKQCIFCQIISGKVQSRKIYSDDICTAVMDINPANPGHILLLPNEHYAIMALMPDDTVTSMFKVAKKLSNVILKALKAEGTTIFGANGIAAGQKAPHFMLHIIPRMPDDGIDFKLPQKQLTETDMQEIHKRVFARLEQLLGHAPTILSEQKKEEKVDLDSISKLLK